MTIDKVVHYVLHTPHNTNKAILIAILKELIISYGGSIDGIGPDPEPEKDIIYDGGMEQ